MESKEGLEVQSMTVTLEEEVNDEDKKVYFVVEELENVRVEFSDSDVSDVKQFFDLIFEYVINERKLVKFHLESEIQGLFREITIDLIEHLNDEIENSRDQFAEIIQFKEHHETID